MYNNKLKSQNGFTLVELLTVCAVIGALAGIALTAFSRYQASARDQQALVLLRQLVVAEEAYFSDKNSYVSCDQTNCITFFPEVGQVPSDIDLEFTSTGTDCSATASHVKGSGRVYSWSS